MGDKRFVSPCSEDMGGLSTKGGVGSKAWGKTEDFKVNTQDHGARSRPFAVSCSQRKPV